MPMMGGEFFYFVSWEPTKAKALKIAASIRKDDGYKARVTRVPVKQRSQWAQWAVYMGKKRKR